MHHLLRAAQHSFSTSPGIRSSGFSLALAIVASGCPAADDHQSSDEVQDEETTQSQTTDEDESTDSNVDSSDTGEPHFESYDSPGPHQVGTTSFLLGDPGGERDLVVQLWYPAAEMGSESIAAFVPLRPDASAFADLLASAPAGCTRQQTSSAFHVAPDPAAGAPLPTVLFSHCHTCTRFSSYSLAERLASHGFLVVAVDHAGNTLFDELAGEALPVDVATLELRAADMQRVLDELLDPQAQALPSEFVGLVDSERVGVFGHSFGSVTTGKLLQDDDRFAAGVAIAAPIENPLLPGVSMAAITEPVLMLVAVEDNSITEFGNNAIRTNFAQANTPVWKIEFADAGHWSFSDICGLIDAFQPGCGMGQRQTNPDETFTYLDNELARELAAARVTAFFAYTLRDEAEAREQVEQPDRDGVLDIQVRE